MTEIDDLQFTPEYEFCMALRWWDKKRLLYNLILLAAGIVFIAQYSTSPIGLVDLVGITIYGVVANMFFTIPFLLEVYENTYAKGKFDFKRYRLFFFILGLGFSLMATFVQVGMFYSSF